jgi:hypothetical protein
MNGTLADIPRFYTALAEWWACLIFIATLKPRVPKYKARLICAAALILQAVFMIVTGNIMIAFWVPCMIVAFLLMLLLIYSCCRLSVMESAYYAVIAFLIAEFSASLVWQILQYFVPDLLWKYTWQELVIVLVVYKVINGMFFLLMRNRVPEDGYLELDVKSFFSALMIGVAAFAVSNLSFVTKNTPFSGSYAMEIANIRTIIDFAGITMLYAHMLHCSEQKIKRELEAVQNALQTQYKQYKQWRDSINLINIKYHDLKHQIEFLRHEKDEAKRDDYLNQMEDEIRAYELQNKTGNSVLDTVLTGKSLYCNKHGITLTTVVDGALLDFLNAMDICSIFGNALDNAIESELKIPTKDKRLIHLTVTKQKSFLFIRFENYYEGSLKYMENGSIATTKREKGFHGYGIKSIQYTVNKYDGAVDINAKNNWFDMQILIPIP